MVEHETPGAAHAEKPNAERAASPHFRQPKSWLRWTAVILALAGYYVSFLSLRVSLGGAATQDPFMRLVCGEGGRGCQNVLTSDAAYIPLSRQEGAPRMPTAALGMVYFAIVGLWYLFAGPPTRPGRWWHLVIAAFVLLGALWSLYYMQVMATVLREWCASCLTAHALNGGLVLLTLIAWPWGRRRSTAATPAHPTPRLALSLVVLGMFVLFSHLSIVLNGMYGQLLQRRTTMLQEIFDDPAYVVWNFSRQPTADLNVPDDEFIGPPDAPHRLVIFSDFQCPACRVLHERMEEVLEKYGDQLQAAYKHYPQDPACNDNPAFRIGGHASACQAARAAEAARLLGGDEAYLRYRELLYERQRALPKRPPAQQSEEEQQFFVRLAAEIGIDRDAFTAAMESPEVTQRIAADIAAVDQLGLQGMPAVYLDRRQLVGWRKMEVWDALLSAETPLAAQTAPADNQP